MRSAPRHARPASLRWILFSLSSLLAACGTGKDADADPQGGPDAGTAADAGTETESDWCFDSSADPDVTVGLIRCVPGEYHGGYSLFTPRLAYDSWLIDARGRLVYRWSFDTVSNDSKLLPNGNLLRVVTQDNPLPWRNVPVDTGRVEVAAPDGTLV